MNRDCERAREYFSPLLDGELDDELRATVEEHLAECSECLLELEAMKRVSNLYAGLPTVQAPEGFEEQVAQALTPNVVRFPGARLAMRRVWPLAAAAAVLLCVALPLLWPGSDDSGRFHVSKLDTASEQVPAAGKPVRGRPAPAMKKGALEAPREVDTSAYRDQAQQPETPALAQETNALAEVAESEPATFDAVTTVLGFEEEAAPEKPVARYGGRDHRGVAGPDKAAPGLSTHLAFEGDVWEVAGEEMKTQPMPPPPAPEKEESAASPPLQSPLLAADAVRSAPAGAEAAAAPDPLPQPAPAFKPKASLPAPVEAEPPIPAASRIHMATREELSRPPEEAETAVVPQAKRAPALRAAAEPAAPPSAQPQRRKPSVYYSAEGIQGSSVQAEAAARTTSGGVAAGMAPASDAADSAKREITGLPTAHIADRTFQKHDNVWQEVGYAGEETKPLRRDLGRFKKLAGKHPELTQITALKPEVIFQIDGAWYHLKPAKDD